MAYTDQSDLRKIAVELKKEQERRRLRASFTGEGGLLRFVKHFWHVLEPMTPFIDGWPLHAVCDHLQAITDGRINRLLINVPPGFCKALAHDTPVLTTWGWKKHGDLTVDDFVFGADGKPKRITACSDEMIKDAYEVEFDDGSIIVAGEDHLWAIERDVMSVAPRWSRGRKAMVVKTTDLRPSGVRKGQVDLRPDRIAVASPVQFPPKRLPIDPYVLGAWLGDGTSNAGNISTSHQDVEHFVKLGRIGTVYPPSGTRKQAFYRLVIDGLHASLKQNNLLKNKHIPLDYLESSIEQRWALLQGLMDTDGHCAKNGACSFSNKNRRLIDEVHQLVCSLGIKATVTSHEAKIAGKSYGLHHVVCFTPLADSQVFRLQRKQARIAGSVNGRSRNRYVVDVRLVGKLPMKCIQVEDSLYLAGKNLITTHNSLLTDVFYPAWEWGAMKMPHLRYVTFSYSSTLTERDNRRFSALVTSPEFQDLFGEWVEPVRTGDRNVSNKATGWKLASSVGGVSTGERGDRIILDDPHNVKEAESEIVRTETVRWFRESMSNRLNNMETGAIVIIMQRLHGDDVSGAILDNGMDYVHLMVPMEYEFDRQTDGNGAPQQTSIGWYDPRYDDGEPDQIDGSLAWPERFSDEVWDRIKVDIGPYAVAGQYQQRPTPRGGGIFKREWWQLWESPDGKFPVFEYVLASLDSAFTEQERNDPSALTIWGIFQNQEGYTRAMLVHAWRKHLEFSGSRSILNPLPNESKGQWVVRTQKHWGLMEWTKYTCERFKVDHLLIEAKASGISAAQELQNRYGRLDFGVQLCPVKGSKEARALAAQPTFSQLLVYAPERDWADLVISEMESFPKHKYRDLTDSTTQAVKYMREAGLLNTDAEAKAIEVEEQTEWLRRHKKGGVAAGYFD